MFPATIRGLVLKNSIAVRFSAPGPQPAVLAFVDFGPKSQLGLGRGNHTLRLVADYKPSMLTFDEALCRDIVINKIRNPPATTLTMPVRNIIWPSIFGRQMPILLKVCAALCGFSGSAADPHLAAAGLPGDSGDKHRAFGPALLALGQSLLQFLQQFQSLDDLVRLEL